MMKKILNPFDYLPLRQAICWGIAALILISVFCWQVGLRLSSLTQINYGGGALWRATAQQVVAWLLFSVVLYVVALLFSRSKVRFWEYNSRDTEDNPIDLTQRATGFRKLDPAHDREWIRYYSDPANILYGWNPRHQEQ